MNFHDRFSKVKSTLTELLQYFVKCYEIPMQENGVRRTAAEWANRIVGEVGAKNEKDSQEKAHFTMPGIEPADLCTIEKETTRKVYVIKGNHPKRSAVLNFADGKFEHCQFSTNSIHYDINDWQFINKLSKIICMLAGDELSDTKRDNTGTDKTEG